MAKKRLAAAAALLFALVSNTFAQDSSALWRDVAEAGLGRPSAGRQLRGSNHRVLAVDRQGLGALLSSAPVERFGLAKAQGIVLELPMPRGGFQRFRVEESSILDANLAALFPEIKTYRAQGIDDPTATARLDLTPQGFHAMVLAEDDTTYIDPYSKTDTDRYVSYLKSDFSKEGALPFKCEVHGSSHPLLDHRTDKVARASNGTQLRTYRLAVSATGEYTTFHGGTVAGAQAAIATTINRNTGIYERELAVRFTLVAAPSAIYTNAATDPFVNSSADIDKNAAVLNGAIGAAAYDIGHVFQNAPGGVAYLGSVCGAGGTDKAGGVTGTNSPMGDPFDVDYVAHELGHQFGGNHSFNGTASACSQRNAGTASEVGSGSTIQAYAGICGVENLQKNTDDIFHSVSLDEMQAFITTGGGNTCGAVTATGNTPPTVSAGASYTIPKGTPFALTATGSDVNGDAITYAWEERSLGTASTDPTSAHTDDGTRPLFRAFRPSTSPTRLFPKLTDILGTTVPVGTYINGETMPTTARTMTFHVTARDNRSGGGGTNDANMTVTINTASGPFKVTSFAAAATMVGGSSQTVTWDVAGTTAAPVSCANVAIGFSTDGGVTFSTILASTANNGSANVTVPNTPTTTGRFRVGCVGNIFLDITKGALTVTAGALPTLSNPVSSGLTASTATIGGTIASDGGSPVTARGVVYAPTATNSNPVFGGTGVLQKASTSTTDTFAVDITGLTGATSYSYKAYATTANGTGYTAANSFTTTPSTVPGPPMIGTATAGNTTVSVAFTAPTNNGGSPITAYTATCGTQGGSAATSPITVTGLTNGTAVTCTVVATNAVGTGPASAASNSVTPAPQATVSSPTSTGISGNGATLGGNVTSDGGSTISERGVVHSLTSANANPLIGGTGVTKSTATGTTGVFTVALTNLVPESGYSFKAYATNSAGTAYTSVSTFTTLAGTTIPRLKNISTRGAVGTGDSVMIGGFIVGSGGSPKKVVITGRGPLLADPPYNLGNTLSDPHIILFQGSTEVAPQRQLAAGDQCGGDHGFGLCPHQNGGGGDRRNGKPRTRLHRASKRRGGDHRAWSGRGLRG